MREAASGAAINTRSRRRRHHHAAPPPLARPAGPRRAATKANAPTSLPFTKVSTTPGPLAPPYVRISPSHFSSTIFVTWLLPKISLLLELTGNWIYFSTSTLVFGYSKQIGQCTRRIKILISNQYIRGFVLYWPSSHLESKIVFIFFGWCFRFSNAFDQLNIGKLFRSRVFYLIDIITNYQG